MRARLVFEKFSEDGDPIVDMGIGFLPKIKKWIDNNINPETYKGIHFKQYDFINKKCLNYPLDKDLIIINKDLTLDVKGWVDMSGNENIPFPYYIRFNRIYGDFSCSFPIDNYIKYMPKEVNGELRFYIDEPLINGQKAEMINNIKKVCKVSTIIIKDQ